MPNIILLIVLLISLVTDLKERTIYNKVVLPGMVMGMVINIYFSGLDGLLFSLKGLGVGLGVLLIPFLLGGMGAGDVKLLGAVGAIKGSAFVFNAFLLSALAGGIIALIILLKQKKVLISLKRILTSLYILSSNGNVKGLETLDTTEYSNIFPYGVAITIGTIVALIM